MANNKECWICGKTYNYCPKCEKVGSWRAIACSPEHFQIDTIIREYREGIITKNEAVSLFDNIGINNKYDFKNILPSVVNDIKKIIDMPDVQTCDDKDTVEVITTKRGNKKK